MRNMKVNSSEAKNACSPLCFRYLNEVSWEYDDSKKKQNNIKKKDTIKYVVIMYDLVCDAQQRCFIYS